MQSTINKEVWKPILGYEGRYEVSNMGNVRSCDRIKHCRNQVGTYDVFVKSKPMAFHYLKRGYIQIILTKDGKRRGLLVHRLVAQAFLPNPENKPEVNHKDRNPSNNCSL